MNIELELKSNIFEIESNKALHRTMYSSLIRKLYRIADKGFRKVDADKWEFANEWFLRGQKSMLKNIQRRRSPQPLQIGSSSRSSDEAGKSAVLAEIEQMRKERALMTREVVELQHQQRNTVQHMEIVNEKLRTAEKKQKQMVSFLGKVLENPAFLAHLQETNDKKKSITSHKTRKFVTYKTQEPGASIASLGGPSNLQGAGDNQPFGIVEEQLLVEDNLVVHKPLAEQAEDVVPNAMLMTSHSNAKGKDMLDPQPVSTSEYFVSFPDELVEEKSVPEFSMAGPETMATEEGIWSMGFEGSTGMSGSTPGLWDNVSTYNVPELGSLVDVWDNSLLADHDKTTDHMSSVDAFPSQEDHYRDDTSNF